jgi:hypothetical protein
MPPRSNAGINLCLYQPTTETVQLYNGSNMLFNLAWELPVDEAEWKLRLHTHVYSLLLRRKDIWSGIYITDIAAENLASRCFSIMKEHHGPLVHAITPTGTAVGDRPEISLVLQGVAQAQLYKGSAGVLEMKSCKSIPDMLSFLDDYCCVYRLFHSNHDECSGLYLHRDFVASFARRKPVKQNKDMAQHFRKVHV